MKLKVFILILIFLFTSLTDLSAGSRKDLLLKAFMEKNPEAKIKFLLEYVKKYGEKDVEDLKKVYIHLIITTYKIKQYNKAIEYGEKILGFSNLGDNHKMTAYLVLANAYNVTKTDVEKAFEYADLLIKTGNNMKAQFEGKSGSEAVLNRVNKGYIQPSLRIQMRILRHKASADKQAALDAIKKSHELLKIAPEDKFPTSLIKRCALILAKDHNAIPEAITTFESVYNKETPEYSITNLLAQLYYRIRKEDPVNLEKSIAFMEIQYRLKPKASLALKIGTLLSKKDKEKSLKYFIDAFILENSDKESKAYKYMQQLWFKEIAKDQKPAEREEGFNKLIEAAKTRLGIEG